MTPDEEAAFMEKLAKQFVLIPRNRLYHGIGGALAFLVVAFGINIGAVLAYLRTQPAKLAQARIEEIATDVKQHQKAVEDAEKAVEQHSKDMGVGAFLRRDEAGTFLPKSAETNFLKRNDPYYIQTANGPFALHVHDDKLWNGADINLAADIHQKWILVPAPRN